MDRTTAVVAGLALGLLALAPTSAQGEPSASVSVAGGNTIQVVGDSFDNLIYIADQSDPACPDGSPCYEIRAESSELIPSAPCVAVAPESTGFRVLCPASGISQLKAFGREGDDSLVVSNFVFGLSLQIELSGGPDDDSLQGGAGRDVIYGNEGEDTILSRDGHDLVYGNSGKDRVYGSKGKDTIFGGPGFDNLIGGLGPDLLVGGAGNDGMDGSQGNDVCSGGKGHDTARRCEHVTTTP
jgi:Ca2+-binding RTX toxin-like protein